MNEKNRRDVFEVLVATFVGSLLMVTFLIFRALLTYEPPPVDTTCRDAESLQMRDDCDFGRDGD